MRLSGERPRPGGRLDQLNQGTDHDGPAVPDAGDALVFVMSGGRAGNNFHLYVSFGDASNPPSLGPPVALAVVNGPAHKADHGATFSEDGSLFFVSDRGGRSDVYFARKVRPGKTRRDSWGPPTCLRLRPRVPHEGGLADPEFVELSDGRWMLVFVVRVREETRLYASTCDGPPGSPRSWSLPMRLDDAKLPSGVRDFCIDERRGVSIVGLLSADGARWLQLDRGR